MSRGLFTTIAIRIVMVAVVAVLLAGCGKKGNPQPPPDVPNTYPKRYPSS
jgi:predicted small lipoprotein YifL